MAIDTAAKRSSALDHEEPWQFGTPFPDGTISQADRQHLAHIYGGILIAAAAVVTRLGKSVPAALPPVERRYSPMRARSARSAGRI